MLCPKSPSEVRLTFRLGSWERYIGRNANGPRRWRFGADEASAKVKAWETWRRWEQRPKGVRTWEQLETHEMYAKGNAQWAASIAEAHEQAADRKIADAVATVARAKAEGRLMPKSANVGKVGISIVEGRTAYLDSLRKRIGLVGSLGIVAWTYRQTEHKLARALDYLPDGVSHLAELDYPILERWVYAIAARPMQKPNPRASAAVQATQAKRQISQRTALGWIEAVKAMLLWLDDDGVYEMPRHAKRLWQIRPEAEEQVIRTLTSAELTRLWHGCINQNAHRGDKGERRRLYLLLGLNCGFYGVDIATLKPEHIVKGDDGRWYIWKLRRKTRKVNSKLARTTWLLWDETVSLLNKYMPLDVTPNQIRMSWLRLAKASGVAVSHSNLRDTGAVYTERLGGRELADTYLAHARGGVIDSYSHPHWERLSDALTRFYTEFVKPAIDAPNPLPPTPRKRRKRTARQTQLEPHQRADAA